MAFEQGTASSQEDFATKFKDFAVANGWTADEFSTSLDRMSLHKGGIFFHWGWDNTTHIEVHQSKGWTMVGLPDSHTNDSGQGGSTTSDRAINNINDGPFTSYHFFAGSTPTEYLYAVLEYAPGQYRHFHAGDIEKIGDWTGGEFVACTTWTVASATNQISTSHCVSMDGACHSQTTASTMRVEGLPNQAASGKWGLFSQAVTPGNDGDGNGRENLIGGMRGGPYTYALGGKPSSLTQGFVPLILIPCFYLDTSTDPDRVHLLGYFPNIRVINLAAFLPAQEFVVGSDTWIVFPMIRRQEGGSGEQTGFGGIAYLKV